MSKHGLARVVTPRGTAKVELIRDGDGDAVGEIYRGFPIAIAYPRRT